ncbi:ATP-binding protein [Phytohabitans sp. LJ34]|uniref:ATP-binding protein n=1 Tax=Phytohabitans sp. LJ34 TaxID=3452217 RepID=UPI003F8C8635
MGRGREIIGRDHPAGVLRAEVARAAESHGGLVLVTGEAGIGKTTLVTGAADEARARGALVLGGACWDSESAPGYWPWVQAVRALRRAAAAAEWAAAEEAGGAGLAALLGERSGGDPLEGFELYDALTTALVAVSHHRPVVVVLDDLHWADTASLRLLEFVARHTWFERLLIVGTYRDVEVEATDHPLRPLMAPLVAKATTVTLTGLERDEVGALIARTVGQEPEADLVTEVHLRTGGNPFFVEQTARLWRGGAVSAIAPGVRDAVRRRLSQLPEAVAGMLTAAAVLGREFHRQVLAATLSAPVPEVDRLIDQAMVARLVVALGEGRFAFAHDLVRETLYDALDDAERRRLHATVVQVLDRDLLVPGDLARHAWLAGGELEPERVVDVLVRAARDAGSRFAMEECVGHLRRAYERSASLPRRRVVVGLDLVSDLRHGGEGEEASRIYDEVVALARQLGDPELLARAALTTDWHEESGRAALLREAYPMLAGKEWEGGDEGLTRDLASRTVDLARARGDDEALQIALWARHDAIWGPGTADERVGITAELMRLARREDNKGRAYFAASFRWVALLERGDPAYLDQYEEFVAIASSEGKPRSAFSSAIDQTIIATVNGRFDDAETLLERAVAAYSEHHQEHDHFTDMVGHLRWSLYQTQGRYEELPAPHELLDERRPHRTLLAAITAAATGDPETAVRVLPAGAPRMYEALRLRAQAQVAAAAGDAGLRERARADLLPYTGQWLVSLYGCDVSGPVDLWLGALDAAEGHWDAAVRHLTAAAESADRLRSRPWAIEARRRLADALAATDAEAASALRRRVDAEAAAIGMRLAGAPPSGNEFRLDGAVWVLCFAGHQVHVPDAKGLRDLHLLLGAPGRDIPAVELLSPEGGALVVAARRMGGDPVLDEEAKSRYKQRLVWLDDEIDKAASPSRVAELDRERKALIDELRAAAGLGGRTRRLGDEAERARKTVTARIRDTLRRLDESHPELAAHLRTTVSTGATCRYDPQPSVTWRL